MRQAKLKGEQLQIWWPKRGRPRKQRQLERAGQMQLELQPATAKVISKPVSHDAETFDDALQMTFPVAPPTEDELHGEFCRLFPA